MGSGYRGRRSRYIDRSQALVAVIVLAVLALVAAAAVVLHPQPEPGADSGSGIGSGSGTGSGSSGSAQAPVQQNVDISSVQPPQQPDRSKAPPEVKTPDPYDFSQPVPEGAAVENRYFKDAAFVGDSRTDGFMIYSGIGTGKNLTSNGLSIFSLSTKKALTIGGEQYTLLEALAREEYGKVYLSLGVNELGYHDDEGYYQKYSEAIDEIRRIQPNAVIYIQGLIPLNEEQIRQTNGNKYNLTNEHLRVYNDLMRRIAQEKQVAFLDLYSEFADENGSLPEEASKDGVHLSKEYCQRWLAYLQTHTVEFDTLYPDGPPAAAEPNTAENDGSGQA